MILPSWPYIQNAYCTAVKIEVEVEYGVLQVLVPVVSRLEVPQPLDGTISVF